MRTTSVGRSTAQVRSTRPWSCVAEDPVHRDLDDHAGRVLPRLPVAAGRTARRRRRPTAASSRTTAVPSRVTQRRPSTWQTATRPCPSRTCRAFADVPEVITRAVRLAGSKVTPTGTTCGLPSARSVVSVARCRSVRNASSSGPRSAGRRPPRQATERRGVGMGDPPSRAAYAGGVVFQKLLRAGEGKLLRRLSKIADAVESLADEVGATDRRGAAGQDRRVQGAVRRRRVPRRAAARRPSPSSARRPPARWASGTTACSSWAARRCTSATSPR